VALVRIDGHATWVNSAALHEAGISRDTADPTGGIVVKDAGGEPTGLLIDTAQRLVQRAEPLPSPARFDEAVRAAIAECLSLGLTGLHEMGVTLFALASYRRLVERGQFPFRNYAAVAARSEETWDFYRDRGPEVIGDGRVVVRALKLMSDGALGSRGAALHSPYCDDPDNRGLLLIPAEELARLTNDAIERGFQVCVHAIGDRANTLTLDTFEQALARHPAAARAARLRVEHAQILAEADIPRFRALGVVPSMQATHCTSDMDWAIERLGPDRLKGAYAWRSLLGTGVVIAGGSDFPRREPQSLSRHLCVGRAAAPDGRGPRVAARAAHDEARGRALLHDVECLCRPPGGRAGRARPRQAGRSHRLLRRRLRLSRGADEGHPPPSDHGRRRDRPRARGGPGLGRREGSRLTQWRRRSRKTARTWGWPSTRRGGRWRRAKSPSAPSWCWGAE
jgi:hypothetical protein